jgi:NTE family protein
MKTMKKKIAIVLSGGGARGALHVGALRALLEANVTPEMLVGTSIGACNAAFIALHGMNQQCLDKLTDVWRNAATTEILPSNYLWLSVRMLFNRRVPDASNRMRDFMVTNGLLPDLCFGDLQGVRLLLVAADLNRGVPTVFGDDPSESILQGVLASTALPPWVTPLERGNQLLMDGGIISNLPIQAAIEAGADEIIALDLSEAHAEPENIQGFGPFFTRVIHTVQKRQLALELDLAEARHVPTCYIRLSPANSIPLWDFSHTEELMVQGYTITAPAIARWLEERQSGWHPKRLAKNLQTWMHRLRLTGEAG